MVRERIGIWILRRLAHVGELHVSTPNGTYVVGSGSPRADITLSDRGAVVDVIRKGLLGFSEAYMDERVDTSDLRELLLWGTANQRSWFRHPLAMLTDPFRRIWQRIRPERRHPRVATMNDHYNLSNEFYESWLDETMTYSSARFTQPGQHLADAQRNKYRMLADHVGLKPGMRVLEIGCGWGGFAEYAARERRCAVLGITLAEEHARYASKRMAGAGLTGQVEIRIQDFRDVTGEFDAIVSIEMIESVDETHWPPLFDAIRHRLRPGARAAMQVITIDDAVWERYRSRADFIQQYIFPGGQLPAPKVLRALAAGQGLDVEQIETFGLDYARTLATWRDRFIAAWPKLEEQHDLDERFRRMWDLYLTLCEAGFRIGRINVEQWVFSRPQLPAPSVVHPSEGPLK